MKKYAHITGWGMYVPEKRLTNFDLEKMVDTSNEWILERTGIQERRIVSDDETASTMSVQAGLAALDVARLSPQDLDLVIVATVSPDNLYPSCASIVQDALGAKKAAAFDIGAGCSGFLYGLSTASQFIATGLYRNILVIGAEAFSRTLDWKDRNTCVLFGDGAGALVLESSSLPGGALSFILGSDGSGEKLLHLRGLCARPVDYPSQGRPCMYMNGPEVFKFAVTAMVDAARRAIDAAGLSLSDINLFIPHQANYRIIQTMTRFLHLGEDRVFINIQRYGNTVSASIPIALCEAMDQGRIREGDRIALVSFGTGFTWGGVVIHWGVHEKMRSAAVEKVGVSAGISREDGRQ